MPREFTITIDDFRSVAATFIRESGNIVLTAEDPFSVAVIEMNQERLEEVIEGLTKLRAPRGT
jgi:hypothetical protein